MYGYRLTRRGKFVLTVFAMMIFMVGIVGLKNNVIASDKSEYLIQASSYDRSISEKYELDLRKTAIKYNKNILKFQQEALNKQEEFLKVSVEDIRSYDKAKLAFLTFDDGPSKNVTPEILNILDNYNIKATFFVLGSMCEKNSTVLKEVYDKGHSIGIHSYSHKLREILKSKESFNNEIDITENVLKQHLGESFSTRLFRFPGGSFEENKQQYIDDLNERGFVSVDWNALTGDTEYSNPTPEILLERLKATVLNKNNIVVLMHDSENKYVTAQILPDVIEYLKSEGYDFAVLK